MILYEVSYWSEGGGPSGRSGIVKVDVLAKNKKLAIQYVIEKCGVYSNDRPYVTAKNIGKMDAVIVRMEDL